MGKLNFREYLISRFFPTRENLMRVKNMFYSISTMTADVCLA